MTSKMSRRRFVGGLGVGSAGLLVARGAAAPRGAPESLLPPEAAPKALAAATGARPLLLHRALAALDRHASVIPHRDVVGIVDFAAPSRSTRFHLVDVASGKVSSYLVAHGRGSDPANSGWVEQLSNRPGSNASCAGSFLTGETYIGKHGRSRRLAGLEPENDKALSRAIVIHAASYVDDQLASTQGRIGRSHGCFAVSEGNISEVLERLGPGRLLFAARPETLWASR